MIIKKLRFENFRNLSNGEIIPCEKVNVIYGDNAQGKTNLLEAIWLFCGGRSFRGAKENELIHFDDSFFKLNMDFYSFDVFLFMIYTSILFEKSNKKRILSSRMGSIINIFYSIFRNTEINLGSRYIFVSQQFLQGFQVRSILYHMYSK